VLKVWMLKIVKKKSRLYISKKLAKVLTSGLPFLNGATIVAAISVIRKNPYIFVSRILDSQLLN